MKNIFDNVYFTSILNAISDGILIADGQGKVLWLNHACENLANISRSKIIGKTANTLENQGVFMPSATKMVLNKQNTVSTVQTTVQNRKYITSGHPIKNEQGKIELIVAHARDITEAVRTNSQLEETQELLKRYSQEIIKIRQKNDFVASEHFFMGKSPAYLSIISMVDKIASTDTTVLITGETGVGKNVISNRIHQLSERCHEPFMEINCGAMPESLIESELFGYKKGAFTGANSEGKAGLIKMADKGTLFLDEIGELPLHLQAKLLQFIQHKKWLPIGGTEHQTANLRIIAATNRDLLQQVQEGKFRSDLFYRLNVLPIRVPSVKERKMDIIDLLQFNLKKYNKKHKRECKFSKEVLKNLQAYDWPGNIRELENQVERLVIISAHDEIRLEDLPFQMQQKEKTAFNLNKYEKGKSLTDILETIEREIIEEAYAEFKTTRKTADKLGITQSLLMRRVRKYGSGAKRIR
ncbi:sigma-54 interaction domain-containing protein [Peribacillus castrilensis]|uniref:sigma-54 interaction domain-containing protein n=1 Tax=Bacillaceae TaxID=186817 RepID=UPI00065F7636|nr:MULTISPECIES: sigma 54-interacting transcriptional regulator [Bacillaceae]MCF7620460.1 sigma 54-interacting transcriptional regulator [Peribacillus frigoritolerans]MCP1156014.1 sigma 54-interacting transcriptional regulator [Peribacillus frigoritolerans]MCT1390416.1 sigma 54-interacting transcriptional regulator [Peribacillus frigoritolerans]PRA86847.1 transcriptional regulator [Peribacillus simplex]